MYGTVRNIFIVKQAVFEYLVYSSQSGLDLNYDIIHRVSSKLKVVTLNTIFATKSLGLRLLIFATNKRKFLVLQ